MVLSHGVGNVVAVVGLGCFSFWVLGSHFKRACVTDVSQSTSSNTTRLLAGICLNAFLNSLSSVVTDKWNVFYDDYNRMELPLWATIWGVKKNESLEFGFISNTTVTIED